ncbi:MAG TPA: substrate-binding domain-containing protein [Xanthobacteraceae bacterium]|jgi:ribose transport system substrate-binding protein|nr:substrate-binding domain-containing protein [Xanthobacteraceae bacterium]
MKKYLLATSILAGLGFVAPAMTQTKPTISVIVKDTTSVYWQTVLAGARKAGQDLGANVAALGAQTETDVPGQIDLLKKAADSHPAAIVIAPAQSGALGTPIEEASKLVKIIVAIDSTTNTKALTSSVTTDEVQAGRVAADTLAEAITKTYADTEGDVAIITASPGASVVGFREQVGKKYRALNVLPDQVAESQAANGANIIKDLVAGDRDLRGVFVSNALLAEGASQVAYNKSGDSIQYVVLGADDKLLKSVQDGTVAAPLVRDPFRIGYEGVKTALAAAKGEQVPPTIDIGTSVITKANMSSARSQQLLNPKID